MTYIDDAMRALAEIGYWVGPASPDAELTRVEIRNAARKRKVKVRTGIGSRGLVYAITPDGLPAEEPWRGAAIHASESGAMFELARQAINGLSTRPNEATS